MAVVYMQRLEKEPDTYDIKFTELTKGINLKVQDWILEHIDSTKAIIEVGCGTGLLAAKMALKGNSVLALDKNLQMINIAMKNYPNDQEVDLLYQIGSFTDWSIEDNSKDLIVSTFMLSELRPLEQQIFLRNAWKKLKSDGHIILAAEFIPSGFWKIIFKIKRGWYKKKLRQRKLKKSKQLNWFFKYIEPIGYKITDKKEWKHGAIQVLELQKIKLEEKEEPGFYNPKPKKFNGIRSQLRILRCLFTGQIDRVPIEPGIYRSGNPD
ncbi:MAG: class I SAM-dependent methyltransferase, partial [Promethearchaeota archaeon]